MHLVTVKRLCQILAVVSVLFQAANSLAYFDPILRRSLNYKEIPKVANNMINQYRSQFLFSQVVQEFTKDDQEQITPEYLLSVRQSLEKACSRKIFEYMSQNPDKEIELKMSFEVLLDMSGSDISAMSSNSGSENRYRDHMPMQVSFIAKVARCESDCQTQHVEFANRKFDLTKSCRSFPVVERVGDFETPVY